MKEDGLEVEIVFVSSDSDQSSFDGYYASMSFAALPFESRQVAQSLGQKYGVRGIPSLIILGGSNGEVVDRDGRSTVTSARGDTSVAWKKWSA